MMNSLRHLFCLMALGAVSLLLVVACTDPGLCYEEYHPHSGGVYFSYEWDEGARYDTAGTMHVLAVRIINHKKYGMVVDVASPNHGHYIYNSPESVDPWVDTTVVDTPTVELPPGSVVIDPYEPNNGGIDPGEPQEEPDTTGQDTPELPEDIVVDHFDLGEGVYKFFTMSTDTTEVRYTNVGEYLTSPGDGMQASDVMVSYRSYQHGDSLLRNIGGNWTDYNSAFEYIQPDFQPIYVDSIDITDVLEHRRTDVVFHPHPITQHIDINFTIRKIIGETPFVVDSVWAEISGIPSKAYLYTGHLYLAKTRKMKFNTQFVDANGQPKADTEQDDSVRVHAAIDVLSIMNAAGPEYQTGPGFLQLKIKAHAVRRYDNGRAVLHTAIFQTKTNLYDDLMRTQLITYDEGGQWAAKNGDRRELNISTVYTINGTNIMDKEIKPSGIDIWIESGTSEELEL